MLEGWNGGLNLGFAFTRGNSQTKNGEYRATFDFGAVTKISNWLCWQNAFGDFFVTNPPTGKKQNDVVLTRG